MNMREIRGALPGFICDMYIWRRKYDDYYFRIRKENDDHDISAEDENWFREQEELRNAGERN